MRLARPPTRPRRVWGARAGPCFRIGSAVGSPGGHRRDGVGHRLVQPRMRRKRVKHSPRRPGESQSRVQWLGIPRSSFKMARAGRDFIEQHAIGSTLRVEINGDVYSANGGMGFHTERGRDYHIDQPASVLQRP